MAGFWKTLLNEILHERSRLHNLDWRCLMIDPFGGDQGCHKFFGRRSDRGWADREYGLVSASVSSEASVATVTDSDVKRMLTASPQKLI
jgi:hypothetical protein